jgi:hypothetical protein
MKRVTACFLISLFTVGTLHARVARAGGTDRVAAHITVLTTKERPLSTK